MNDVYFDAFLRDGEVRTANGVVALTSDTARDEYGRKLTATWQQVADAGVNIYDGPEFGLFCYGEDARAAGFNLAPRPTLEPMSAELLEKLATLDEVPA
mgnify:CR=1 FL=1